MRHTRRPFQSVKPKFIHPHLGCSSGDALAVENAVAFVERFALVAAVESLSVVVKAVVVSWSWAAVGLPAVALGNFRLCKASVQWVGVQQSASLP